MTIEVIPPSLKHFSLFSSFTKNTILNKKDQRKKGSSFCVQRCNLDFASCLHIYCTLALNLKSRKKKKKKLRKYCGYKIKQIQDGWTEKTQPAARKCLSVCTICCWYLLNGKSCVVFSYLHSFTLSDSVFLRSTATFQQTLEKARPHQAEGSCKKGLVGAIPQAQPRDTGPPPRRILPSQGSRAGTSPPWHTSAFITANPAQLLKWGCGTSCAAPGKQPAQSCTFKYIDIFFPLNASPPWSIL